MIQTTRRVVMLDGQEYIVIKLAQPMGPKDRLLVIGPDGENKLIDVKHLDYLNSKPRRVSIKIED